MYIQGYFKSGKPKRYCSNRKSFQSVESIVNLFISMNGSKQFKDVETNFKLRDIVYNDGTKRNLWEVMTEFGCTQIEKAG